MSKWICKVDLFTLELIDTDDLQNSLYEAFSDVCWNQSKMFGVKKSDKFSVEELSDAFVIFINGKNHGFLKKIVCLNKIGVIICQIYMCI